MPRIATLPRAFLFIILTGSYLLWSEIVGRRGQAGTPTTHVAENWSLFDSITGPGGFLRQLFSVVNSTSKIPLAFQYEKAVTSTLRGLRGGVFLDIGAHRGFYSCLVSNNFE